MVIHGLLDTCSLSFQNVCLLFKMSGFEKVSLKVSDRLLYQSSRVFEKLFLKAFLQSVGVKRSFFDLF